MTKIKYPKALTEVWDWKEKVYAEYKDSTDINKYLKNKTEKLIRRLKLKTVSSHPILQKRISKIS